MNNLLSGTGIATFFLDMHLCVLRYTPAAADIMNLIPSDVGRPVSDLALNVVNYQNLAMDVQSVLNKLTPKAACKYKRRQVVRYAYSTLPHA